MELKPGYKHTELGPLPEDWGVGRLFRDLSCTHGKAHEQFVSEFGPHIIVNSKFVASEGAVVKFSTENFCPAQEGDVLMVLSDLPNGRALAKTYTVQRNEVQLAVNQRVVRLRPDRTSCSGPYAGYALNRHRYFLKFDDGVTQTHLLNKHLIGFQFALPPLEEQEAIAEVLGDVDAQIRANEQLIEKLTNEKEGLSTQLLNGTIRLNGADATKRKHTELGLLPEDWSLGLVGDLGKLFGGLSGKSSSDFSSDAQGRYVPFINVMANITVDWEQLDGVKIDEHEKQNTLEEGDLIFNGSSETPEELGMCSHVKGVSGPIYLNSFCFGMRPVKAGAFNSSYLAYWFRSPSGRSVLSRLAQGSTRYNVSKSLFRTIRLPLPPLEEQEAIAEVLGDVDAQIAAAKKLSVKLKAKKSGLMQSLLTGKIRLA